MYGDIQVLSNIGAGNGVHPSDSFFSSSQMQHPNFNFIPNVPFCVFSSIIPKKEEGVMIKGKEEIESGSGSEQIEGLSGNEQDAAQPPPKKKHFHRHTARQIQEMEAMFKECPHPDGKQRIRLSQDLGLKPRQVKFWFQNRRTQMKAQQDRADNTVLRAENDNLKNDNYRLQAALRNIICPNCGGPAMLGDMSYDEQQLRLENARLKEEFERVCCLIARYNGQPNQAIGPNPPLVPPSLELDMSIYPRHFEGSMGNFTDMTHVPMMPENSSNFLGGSLVISEEEKSLAMELAISSMDELDKWVELFPSIISRSKTLQTITSGASGHANGSLHLMYAELQVLSPLVPTRETHFLRYCQQNAEEGTWAIVDFPLNNFQGNYSPSFPIYKRRPSGCIIQDMPNGYSRVTWVEHAEIVDKPKHQIFNELVNCGVAFGAQRWLAVLQRQCERLASLVARNISDLGVIQSPEARKNLMKLAQRMLRKFYVSLSSSNGQSWTALSDSQDDTVRIATRKSTEPGQPTGLILSAVSTTWLSFPHYQVFDLLRDERRRAQLDVISNGNSLHEVAHIANGSHPGNCISLLRVNVASNKSQNLELILQESCIDESGSLVAYTTVDVDAIQLAMSGGDPSCIPLLPLGFVIVPVAASDPQNYSVDGSSPENSSGCLLTVGLQVLASTIPTAKLNLSSATAINNHISNTVHQIIATLSGGNKADALEL